MKKKNMPYILKIVENANLIKIKIMKTKEEVREFLNSLQWWRGTKKALELELTGFFGKHITLHDMTDEDCKELDYCAIGTTGDADSTKGFIDFEFYYLKMRNRHWLITGTELLDYVN